MRVCSGPPGCRPALDDGVQELAERRRLAAPRTDVQQLRGATLGIDERSYQRDVAAGAGPCLVDGGQRLRLARQAGQLDHLPPVPCRAVLERGGQLARRKVLGRTPGALDHGRASRRGDALASEPAHQEVGGGLQRRERQTEVGRIRLADPVDREEPSLGHDDEDGVRCRGVPQLEEVAGRGGRHVTLPPVLTIVAQFRPTRGHRAMSRSPDITPDEPRDADPNERAGG